MIRRLNSHEPAAASSACRIFGRPSPHDKFEERERHIERPAKTLGCYHRRGHRLNSTREEGEEGELLWLHHGRSWRSMRDTTDAAVLPSCSARQAAGTGSKDRQQGQAAREEEPCPGELGGKWRDVSPFRPAFPGGKAPTVATGEDGPQRDGRCCQKEDSKSSSTARDCAARTGRLRIQPVERSGPGALGPRVDDCSFQPCSHCFAGTRS
jgi:hypothetical protein